MDNDGDTMLSRSGRSAPGGKLTRRLDIPVSEQMESDLIGLATALGVPRSELARQMLERVLYGEVSMLRKITRLAGLSRWDQSPMDEGRNG